MALLKAQELGIKMPAAIQGFIEGQVRLQNTINRMNDAIGSMKKGVSKIKNAYQSGNLFDALHLVLTDASKRGRADWSK